MPTEVSIRIARSDDAEAMAHLTTQLGYPADLTVMPGRLARLTTDQNARAFVAIAGQNVVGMATIHLRSTLNHESPIAQLTLLVVDEAHRGQGVGCSLVRAVEQFARDGGARRINVTTALQRADAHAFYERIGYGHTGRRYGREL